MKVLTCAATLYDQRNTTWASGYARQGKYTTVMHRGLMVFPALANNALKDSNISDIALRIVSAGSGYGSAKDACFYKTDKTTADGTSTSWITSANYLGAINASFYNSTLTFSSLKTSHASLFNAMKTFFESGGQSLALFRNEEPTTKDYSRNYLSFTSVEITIYYEDNNTWYHNGTEWVECQPYYHNGEQFIPCAVYRHNGTAWTR